MKTDDLDLGPKVKILNFLIWNDESTGSKFFYIWKVVLKLKEEGKKRYNQEKKTSIFFLFMHFYLGGRNFINKKGLFYAKFFEFEEFS